MLKDTKLICILDQFWCSIVTIKMMIIVSFIFCSSINIKPETVVYIYKHSK